MANQQIDPYWTTNYCIDRLKQELGSVIHKIKNNETGETVKGRKYYDQARYLQYRVGVYKPTPIFQVYLSDLSARMVKELHSLDSKDRLFVLKQAVGRIFEDINPTLYHNSISMVLRVKLQ